MGFVAQILPYLEIFFGVVLIIAILLQQSSASLGGALGGSDTGTFSHTRRGFERFLFYLTIVSGIIFAGLALTAIILKV